MKSINWLNENELVSSYIMDGLTIKKAKRLAKKDVRDNPYDKTQTKILKQELIDISKIEGGKPSGTYKVSTSNKKLKLPTKLSGFLDIVGTSVFAILATIILVVIALTVAVLIDSGLVYLIWNKLVINFFNVSALSWKQCLIIGFIIALFFGGKNASSKNSSNTSYS